MAARLLSRFFISISPIPACSFQGVPPPSPYFLSKVLILSGLTLSISSKVFIPKELMVKVVHLKELASFEKA